MLFPEQNQEDNICLKQYNYIKFGVNEFDCMMMGIFN
jgi:hypothetical protein